MADNKDKKVLNVPDLRFPEFSGEWEEHYLAEYLDFKNGLAKTEHTHPLRTA